MTKIQSLCVFCGASNSVSEDFLAEGRRFGRMMAEHKLRLVFGAGDCGMMGAVANGCLESGGEAVGVFPSVLNGLEAEHKNLTEIHLVDTMHTRKMMMFERADAFAILPGGFGTMDETFEVITWKQLHTHDKPIILYNYKGFWDRWAALTDQFIDLNFAHPRTRKLYNIVDTAEAVFKALGR